MELEIYRQVLLAGFAIAAVLGAVAYKTNFCTMGAVSDLVNMGDSGRMRAWVLGMAVAVLGVAVLEYLGLADMSLTTSAETGRPPYRAAVFPWPRFVIGGLLFGVGMTMGSGCGNRTMVRIGGGNLKSVAVLMAMGVAGYLMIFTNFGYYVFLQWMQPAFLDLRDLGIADQSLGAVVSGPLGLPGPAVTLAAGLLVAALMLVWVLRSPDFLGNRDNVLAGVVLGGALARRAVVLDGFISGAAGLIACSLCPVARDYLVAAHLSAETGHRIVLSHLGLRPLLNLDMRLGEGTGAVLAMSLVEAAAACLTDMATFAEAGVSDREPGDGTTEAN